MWELDALIKEVRGNGGNTDWNAAGYPISLPFDAPNANCIFIALVAGALDGVGGTVRYADGWLNH